MVLQLNVVLIYRFQYIMLIIFVCFVLKEQLVIYINYIE